MSGARNVHQAHPQRYPKGICTVNIAQEKELREGGFTSMAGSVRPVDMAPLATPTNRTEWRSLATQHLAEEHGGIAKQLAWEYMMGDIRGEV